MSNNRVRTVSFTVWNVAASQPHTSEPPGNLLAPEPADRTGALIGYARVSTSGQLLDRQQNALAEAGCLRVFADKLSGKNADRPELAACLDYLRPGDTLVVPSLDRLSRSLADLIQIVTTLRRGGIGFARLLGVSRATIYKYVPEVTTGRQAVAAALPSGEEDAI